MNPAYLSEEQIATYQQNGFLVVEKFASPEQIQSLRDRMDEILEDLDPEEIKIFTTENQTAFLDRYFLESGDKIRCFFEEEAFTEDGTLTVPKEQAINKVGHAMHDLDPVFQRFSYQKHLYQIMKDLQYRTPGIVQSQYIFKQARIGAKVNPHTDSTFIYSAPLSCIGAWVALEDANVDNGCLAVIKGSHKAYPLQQQYVRNTVQTGTEFIDTKHKRVDWPVEKLEPVEVKAGDLVLLHGEVVHASYVNRSQRSRHAYIMHLIDLECTWSERNWLQRPADFPFQIMESQLF